jgi:hypothetical protein
MSRPRLHADAAAKQRAYRQRIQARRRAQQGPTEGELALAVRDLHIRLQYEAATNPTEIASRLAGRNSLETLRNVVTHILEQLQ